MTHYHIPKPLLWILLACIVLAGTFTYITFTEHGKQRRSLLGTIDAQAAEITLRKNSEGKLIATRQAAEIRIKELERSNPAFEAQLKRDFDIKLKNLRAYQQTNFVASGSGNAYITFLTGSEELFIDTSEFAVNWDSYLTISAEPLNHSRHTYFFMHNSDTIKIHLDKSGVPRIFTPFAIVTQDGYLDYHADVYDELHAPYQYSYSDTIKYAFHMRRERWYSPKKLYGSGMLSNPNAHITNTESFVVKEYRDKRFGIGPYVGYGVSPNGLQWSVGVSVHYSVIKF